MKKIIVCFSLLLFAIVIVACSSDDNQVSENNELFISANKSKLAIGEEITFSAFDQNDKEVTDVEFYVSGTKVTQKHKFNQKGIYYGIAKKKGYKNSRSINISVLDADGEAVLSKLKMTVDKPTVVLGEKVTFEVKIDGKVVTSGYKIKYYQGDVIESNPLVLDKPGINKFVVTKDDYATSEIVEVNVKLVPTATPQTYTVNGKKYEIEEFQLEFVTPREDPNPTVYYDIKGAYILFRVVAIHNVPNFAEIFMKVHIAKLGTSFIYPHEVDKSRISFRSGSAFVDMLVPFTIKADGIDDETTVTFGKILDENNIGTLDFYFKSKDNSLEVKYSGNYKVVFGNRGEDE